MPSDVIVYEIFGFEDKTLPYSLNIIDTPGYGDIRGTEHDDAISHRLFDLFRSQYGVHEMNVVGLVLKASENRLSDRQRYIFDSVASLFGKDMEKNIVILITNSDGRIPGNVLQAVEAANIKCAKDEKYHPVHFLFQNCQNIQRTKEAKVAWEITKSGMSEFADFLEKTEMQNLKQTADVLKGWIGLTACIQNLQDRIQKDLKDAKQEMKSSVMRDGSCTECTRKCPASDHVKEKWRYVRKTRKVPKINEAMKQKYEKGKAAHERLLKDLKEQQKDLQKDRDQCLEESFQHVLKLEEIALNVDSLSTLVHLDFLIEKMEEKDKEKVQKLEEIKSRVDEGTRAGLRYKLTAAKNS
ncbi:uncharacterized protein LOC132992621 [Labrus mixtus]|uniref:uncharacterized protein LOC132992621 n=1 Tax=Labrus mixtus TaxID=508554 RepID=UPI0029C09B99|nr:uncharacterized protein LOC132992621 [Labrus mixtus]